MKDGFQTKKVIKETDEQQEDWSMYAHAPGPRLATPKPEPKPVRLVTPDIITLEINGQVISLPTVESVKSLMNENRELERKFNQSQMEIRRLQKTLADIQRKQQTAWPN